MPAQAGKDIDICPEELFHGQLEAAPGQVVEDIASDNGLVGVPGELEYVSDCRD